MANTITLSEFRDALKKYPDVLKAQNPNPKEGAITIEELDEFRYVDAPTRFSKKAGNAMALDDVKKLLDWKLRHGTYRPTLPKLVASNTDADVEKATQEGFAAYAEDPKDIQKIIDKLTKPLKGVGPALGSLLLAVHDPENVIFFSDEAYRWLVADGAKVNLKYNAAEFEDLFKKAKALQVKHKGISPIEIEKVAYVLIKENEPVKVPAGKREPTGKPRGRPPMAEHLKKAKKEVVPGRGRGRPPANGVAKAKAEPKAKAATNGAAKAAGGKRGRPAKAKAETEDEAEEEKDDEDADADEDADEDEEASTPAPKTNKRKAEGTPKRSAKKAKA
ncbi:hypothetical protein LSUE1_G007572 [Lachnellula suecica]|uniref:Uncharacterized protein n=1 Tax=Lachnellula suecica TaxID=602035 RepID=A0A8T9BUV2_9HELO|nr:hypothetical protein LSUE1_G007572 [Lachnellula suecica]